jgi:hypothetical protein
MVVVNVQVEGPHPPGSPLIPKNLGITSFFFVQEIEIFMYPQIFCCEHGAENQQATVTVHSDQGSQ